MMAALKVLNDNIKKSPEPDEEASQTAKEIVAAEWFKMSSVDTASPLNVEDYLDYFEELSADLLVYMVNLMDRNVSLALDPNGAKNFFFS